VADIISDLRALLGDEAVLTGAAVSGRATSWIDPSPLQARAVVRPRNTAQVAAVLRLCHAARQPVVTYGGGTNLVEATHSGPGDLVLALEQMAAVEAVDAAGHTLTAQAGAPLQRVQEAAEGAGLFFPLDLAARGSATVGGCAAMNAGGVRVLRYGVMRELVLGLEAVLPDGTIIGAMNRMLKNNAGFDLKQLFIGSEGTLGVITRLVLRLYPAPASTETALMAVAHFEQVVQLLNLLQRELGGTLASFEVMWPEYYRLTTTPPALSTPPLSHGDRYYVLAEAQGTDARRDKANFAAALEHAFDAGLLADAVVAGSAQQRAALWHVREDSEQIERQHHLTFGFDVSLPVAEMEAYVAAVRHGLAMQLGDDAACWVYGHLADGNLHINVWSPRLRQEDRRSVEEVVYRPLGRAGGSISAEHGIGLEKKRYLHWSRSDAEVTLMRQLKRTLDPHNILNPGKVFDLAPQDQPFA
jgi:FAD/FMN-containing dehydrogenase